MNWYISAIISALFFSGQFLLMQRLQKSYEISVYMAFVWTGAGVLLCLFFLRTENLPLLIRYCPILVLGGIASWAGMYAYNLAIQVQSNLGYIEAISSIRVVIIYGVSIIFLNTGFELIKLLSLTCVVIGVFLVTGIQDSSTAKNRVWIFWGFLSAIMFAILIICSKLALSNGLSAPLVTAAILFIAGLIYAISAYFTTQKFSLSNDFPVLLLTIALAAIGNVAYFNSFNSATNLAYPVVISNTRIIILYAAALIMGHDKLRKLQALGVIITFIGVVFLAK